MRPESEPIALIDCPTLRLRGYFSGPETSRMMGLPATWRIAAPAPRKKTVARNGPYTVKPNAEMPAPIKATTSPMSKIVFLLVRSCTSPIGTDSRPKPMKPANETSCATKLLRANRSWASPTNTPTPLTKPMQRKASKIGMTRRFKGIPS